MKIKWLSIAVLVGALLAGCVTANKLDDLQIGMSPAQVVALLGPPDSKSAQSNIQYYTYYLSHDGAARDQPYLVRFVDEKVESFGRFAQLSDIYNRPVNGQALPAGYGYGAMPTPPTVARQDLPDQLMKLKLLKDKGVLTDEEFQRAKNQLLQGQN